MLGLIKKIFRREPGPDFGLLIKEGATVLDVRTPGEFQGGHVKGSINIPLNQLSGQINKLKPGKTIITCCASGMRSSAARKLLESKGFKAYNGGSWINLKKYS